MSKVSIFTAAVGDYPHARNYVRNLFHGFVSGLGCDFTMYVVTDLEEVAHDDYYLNIVPLGEKKIVPVYPDRRVWGWWNLMELYRPDAPWSDGHVIMTGLDTVIRGDVSWLIQPWPMYMRPVRESLGLKGAYDGSYADGAVCLPPDLHYNEVWKGYCEGVSEELTWKQKRSFPMHVYVTQAIKSMYQNQPYFWQDRFPGKLCSYKEPEPKIDEPEEPLVIFHGKPRPHEAIEQSPWIGKYFR